MITRLHFYPELYLLVKIITIPSSRRGVLVPSHFRSIAEPEENGALTLYGGQRFIRFGGTGWIRCYG